MNWNLIYLVARRWRLLFQDVALLAQDLVLTFQLPDAFLLGSDMAVTGKGLFTID